MKSLRTGLIFVLLVSVFLVLPVQTAFSQGTGSISGTVRGPGGTPLQGVSLSASGVGIGFAKTAADGTYTITGLSAGNYIVYADASGSGWATQYYDHADSAETATSVTVTSSVTTSNINFDLVLGGTITGTVRGPGGTPLQGFYQVVASGGKFHGGAFPSADGTYTITGLTPGSYKVLTGDGVKYVTQYYDHASSNTATAVTVTSGGTVSNINFDLVLGGTIIGTVRGPGGTPLQNVMVSASNAENAGGGAVTAANGGYMITGLTPGSYRVKTKISGYLEQYYDHTDSETATTVTVASEVTTSNINFDLIAADTTPDTFTFADQTGVSLNTVTTSNVITVAGINTPVSISITGGEYSVSTDGGATWSTYSTTTPATVSLNNQVRVRQTSSSSESTTTNTTLTIGGVSDTFSVTTKSASALGTITVIPLPASLNASWTLTGPNSYSFSYSDSSGSDATIGSLEPGSYTVTWGNVAGWDKPASQTQTLAAGESITFTGNYQLTPVIPTPPTSGTQGSNITINGSNFGATQGSGYVDFNGIHGTIVSWSDTQIVVTVPYGATSGCMRIITDYGTSGCMNFSVENPACFPPAKLSNTEYFNIAQDAYDNVTDGNAVLLQAGTLSENVTFDRNITTTLKGGYNCPYDSQSSYTTIDGSLTIKNGTVTVEKLIIK